MEKSSNRQVYIGAFIYALIMGHSFLFTKIALESANPMDILAYRFTAAFIGIMIPRIFGWIKVKYTRESIRRIIPIAILYPLLFFGFQTTGLQYTTSSEAGILSAAAPIFTMILASYFLDEKTTTLQRLSIIVSVLGVVYVSVMKGASLDINNILGIVLLILSTISLAGYSVMGRVLTRDFSNIELSYLMITISFIVYNLIAILNHAINGSVKNFFIPLSSMGFVISILYLGVLSSLVTSLLTNFILSRIEASRMSVFANLGTVITIIAGAVYLKEKIYYYHIIGSILIISGVIGTNYFKEE